MSEIMNGLNKAVSKLQELGGKAVETAKEALDKTDIDEKIVDAAKGIKDKAQELLDKTDIDEKIVGTAKDLKDKAQAAFGGDAPNAPDAPKDVMAQIKDDVAAQVEQIRSAATSTNSIHDYIQAKYHAEAKPEEPASDEAPKA